jgi:hypothetical protein
VLIDGSVLFLLNCPADFLVVFEEFGCWYLDIGSGDLALVWPVPVRAKTTSGLGTKGLTKLRDI